MTSETKKSIGLFEAVGIELEYMIVDSKSGRVSPIAEVLLRTDGAIESEVEHGDIAWCNELVSHVIEVKTNGPATFGTPVLQAFERNVAAINAQLRPFAARLMPTAMHPTMDPHRETTLWPHEYTEVYRTFDAIFGCSGHGWANLQSTHINLPFDGDREFNRLHAAIRFALPIIPALSASSPVVDGVATGWMDTRIDVYRRNARRIPSVTGLVIPEPAGSRDEYEEKILGKIYADLADHDPDGTLRHEWVNARGAIARFDRNTIEIRIVDVQECPRADLAIVAAIIAVVRHFAESNFRQISELNDVTTKCLSRILIETARNAGDAVIDNDVYLEKFGLGAPCTAAELWRHVLVELCADDHSLGPWRETLTAILGQGCLARRILRTVGNDVTPARLHTVYAALSDSLEQGSLFALD